MAFPAPAKSQPLHNFQLPQELTWNNKDGQSSGNNKRRRSMKSPSRRPINAATSASPLGRSPRSSTAFSGSLSQDSASAAPPPPLLQSPSVVAMASRDCPVKGDCLMKQSPVCGESSDPSPNREGMIKNSMVVGGGDSESLSLLRDEALKHFHRRDSTLDQSDAWRKGKSGVIEYRRNHFKNSALSNSKNVENSSNSEQAEKKVEKNPKASEVDGVKKSKILIKFASKNNNQDEDNPNSKEGLLKIGNGGDHGKIDEVKNPNEGVLLKSGNGDDDGKIDEVKDEGKANVDSDEETKIWDLRPRKPKSKAQKVNVVGSSASVFPVKKKIQWQLKNANKSGVNEVKSGGGGGGEKKEKGGSGGGEKKEKGGGGGGEKKEKGKEKNEKEEGEKEKSEEKGEKKEKRKPSFSISLSKEEIEEDIYALTGSKPSRRPKKRAKHIQKHVDFVFPGLWLASITPESYKVSENSKKG